MSRRKSHSLKLVKSDDGDGSAGDREGGADGSLVPLHSDALTSPLMLVFEIPRIETEGSRETCVVSLRLTQDMAQRIEMLVEAGKSRHACGSQAAFLKWCVMQGMLKAAEMLNEPEINNSIAILAQAQQFVQYKQHLRRHRETLQSMVDEIKALERAGLMIAAKDLMKQALRGSEGLTAEWKEEYLNVLGPMAEQMKKWK